MDELVIWSIVGLVAGLAWFVNGFRRLQIRRRIEGLATSKVRSLAMGIIELAGRARLEAPLVDPIYARPCAYFKVVVKEKRGSGKRSRWVTVYNRDSSGTPFFLEDETGVARIVPSGAEIHFPPDINLSTGVLGGTKDEAIVRFIASVAGGGWNSKKITAHFLREGQPVFVVGYAAPAESGRSAVGVERDAARLIKSDPREMKKLDSNNDGQVDVNEWDAGVARKRAELAPAESARAVAAPPSDPVITVTRCPDRLFIIANSEDNLLSKLGVSSWLQIVGGPIVAVASAFYLATKAHLL